jgi:hypothetical protein
VSECGAADGKEGSDCGPHLEVGGAFERVERSRKRLR